MAKQDDTEGRCPACRSPYDKERILGRTISSERYAKFKCSCIHLFLIRYLFIASIFSFNTIIIILIENILKIGLQN